MAERKTRRSSPLASPTATPLAASAHVVVPSSQPETTGRYVIIFKHDALNDKGLVKTALSSFAGITQFASSLDYLDEAVDGADLANTDAIHFPRLGIVVVGPDDERISALYASAMDQESAILTIEPEYMAYALGSTLPYSLDYLRGYRDAVNQLYENLTDGNESHASAGVSSNFEDDDRSTWGLQATRVLNSRYTGQGVKVAVLDTGLDLQHPDFQGRLIVSESFVSGETVQDGNAHGTHCIGTACGPQRPTGSRRYGIASAAQIHVGKVLSNQGSGATSGIVAGIEWALGQGCQVISMSLGANVDQKLQQYEVPIRRALAAGGLIVAAAGNNADRARGNPGFVGPPANSDAAMAVGALDFQMRVANFSARSSAVTGDGGKINIAGPGVDIHSSWPMATKYKSISGTSMAAPHVAGVAALWCEATGSIGADLWAKLTQSAQPLPASSTDVGAGLVQAPP